MLHNPERSDLAVENMNMRQKLLVYVPHLREFKHFRANLKKIVKCYYFLSFESRNVLPQSGSWRSHSEEFLGFEQTGRL